MGRGSSRDGGQTEQRRDRLPAHSRDGRAVAAAVPARPGGQPDEEGAGDRSALQRRRRYRSGTARHSRRPRVPVHGRPGRGRPPAQAAGVLRADGRDAERALGLGRGDVPGRLPRARPGQSRRCAHDGRGDRDRARTRCSTGRRSARRAAACGSPRVDRTWRTTACRPTCSIDNTPADHAKGRDMQIEKAVEVLKAEIAARAKR